MDSIFALIKRRLEYVLRSEDKSVISDELLEYRNTKVRELFKFFYWKEVITRKKNEKVINILLRFVQHYTYTSVIPVKHEICIVDWLRIANKRKFLSLTVWAKKYRSAAGIPLQNCIRFHRIYGSASICVNDGS